MADPPPEEARAFTPLERAAIVLATLDRDAAANILRYVKPEAVVNITKAIQDLGAVKARDRDTVLHGCLTSIEHMEEEVHGTEETAEFLRGSALDEAGEVEDVGEGEAGIEELPGAEVGGEGEIGGEDETPMFDEDLQLPEAEPRVTAGFTSLANMDPQEVAMLISSEQPGIMAMVLRKLPGTAAASVLDALPREAARQAMVFLCTSRAPSEDVIRRVDALLDAQFGQETGGDEHRAGGDRVQDVTGILQQAAGELSDDMLEAISQKSPDLADAIRDRLFTFDDIVRLADTDMRRVLSETDMSIVAVALRGSSDDLKNKFLSNMSKRAASGLEEEMQYSQRTRMSEIRTRRREIVDTVRRLEAEGQITTRGEEYV